MPTATPTATVRTLEKEIFARYGIPEAIHTDCGQQFVGNLMQEVGKALGIEITNTTAYNPKGNGQVERMHRDLNNAMMRAAVEDGQQDSWQDALPAALFALRTATSSTTNLTPYYLLFGRDVSQPLDVIFGQPEKPDYSSAPREYAATSNRRSPRPTPTLGRTFSQLCDANADSTIKTGKRSCQAQRSGSSHPRRSPAKLGSSQNTGPALGQSAPTLSTTSWSASCPTPTGTPSTRPRSSPSTGSNCTSLRTKLSNLSATTTSTCPGTSLQNTSANPHNRHTQYHRPGHAHPQDPGDP